MSKTKKQKQSKPASGATREVKRPTVLVLEGLSGAAGAIRRAGGNATGVSPFDLERVEKELRGDFDALLLTGGGDVDPRLYGEKPQKQTYGVNETRDLAEWMALDEAKKRGIPVLGICRGHQLMAVHNGGKLRQHITGHRGQDHPVIAEEGTTFDRVVNGGMQTVSLHHQVVIRHGRGFRVAARDLDKGYIEAIESTDGRCLGVQFHPEMNYGANPDSRALFRWLVTEAATRAGMAVPAERRPAKRRDTPWWSDRPTRTVPFAPRPAKHRSAGQPTLPGLSDSAKAGHAPKGSKPKGSKRYPITTTWQCPLCSLRFDEMEDRDDHVLFVHGDDRWATDIVPPPGHPDWE